MKWMLSMFTENRDSLAWRHILPDLPKAILWGCLTGPLFALAFQLGLSPSGIRSWLQHPVILLWSCIAGTCFSVPFWVTMGLGNRALRIWLKGYPASIVLPTTIIYNMVGASLAASVAAATLGHLPGPVKITFPFYWQIILIDGFLGGIIALIITAFVKLKKQLETVHSQLRAQESNQVRLAEAAARAQAMALQAQINPHFFFNTLNSISVLIDEAPATAREMISRLSDMFRYTLRCTQDESVALEQEMNFVKDYLGIEQARFQKRLRVEWPQDPLPDIRVPGLVMQPLVENAVKHGIARSLTGGVVQIIVVCESGRPRISVRNTSDQPVDLTESTVFRSGHALHNVRARLRLHTGQSEPVVLQQSSGWTESVITL